MATTRYDSDAGVNFGDDNQPIVLPNGVMFGAFAAGAADLIEWLLQRARTYLFTTASPPLLASARALDEGTARHTSEELAELSAALSQNGTRPHADLAIWFYPPEKTEDERAAELLSSCAETVLLIPAAGVEIANRRPHLVECFGRAGLQHGVHGALLSRSGRRCPAGHLAAIPERSHGPLTARASSGTR